MTDNEKAIVMAYTGTCMLTGDKFQVFHEYVEKLLGRPVYTHEMAVKVVTDEIKEKAKADFMALCAKQEPKVGHWIFKNDNIAIPTGYFQCSECNCGKLLHVDNYCPNCGAKMESEDENDSRRSSIDK